MQQAQRTARLATNDLLRQERQRRGWSRAYIAEEIGVADPKTIGRWERGDSFPSAYFLQKLCALFQMPAANLGLWQDGYRQPPAHAVQQNTTRTAAGTYISDPALPPAPDESLIGRADLLARLRTRLDKADGPAVAALSGWPGVGKTALAVSLAHDRELRRHLSDGVLWACLGPDVDPLDELRRWGHVLGIDENTLAYPASTEDWSRAIHACIGERALLLVIDDAWTCQDALTFKIGGPCCAYLLTTRIPAVALSFAGTTALRVNELGTRESLLLLARFIPDLVDQEPTTLRELARLVGGLPLALQLLGTHLRAHLYSGQPRRWHSALEYLKKPAARLQLTMPHPPLERLGGLPADTPISLYQEINQSYQRLTLPARLALSTLAGLCTDAHDFSEEAALALSGVTLETLDHLLDAGLLASSGLGRYTLHQTIADFAGFQKELAHDAEKKPAQLALLRQLREQGTPLADHEAQQVYTLSKIGPALVQRSGETASL